MIDFGNKSTALVIVAKNVDDIVTLEKEYKFHPCMLSKSEG